MAGSASPFVKSFNCPSCGGPQTIRALGQSVTYACVYCAKLIDINSEPYRIIGEAERAPKPALPLGSKGDFRGEKYEVIGFMERVDRTGEYAWREYLLFNPYRGYRWLTEMYGQWNFVVPVKANPQATSSGVRYNGVNYRRFTLDRPSVKSVMGEFYWRVKQGDQVLARDYVSAPYMLSEESDETEVNYSFAEYLPAAELRKAFGPKGAELKLPPQTEFSPTQPGRFHDSASLVYSTTWLLALIMLVVQIVFSVKAQSKLVLSQYYEPVNGATLTAPFILPGRGNVNVAVNSPVNNSWVEVEFSLVNAETQEDYDGRVEVSYYYGRDSDGPWSEGGQTSDQTIGPVPPGKYQLRVEPAYNPIADRRPFTVIVKRDVPYWGNFLFALIMLFIPAMIVFVARFSSETKRAELMDWDESWLGRRY